MGEGWKIVLITQVYKVFCRCTEYHSGLYIESKRNTMSTKTILFVCANALFLQSAFSQCLGRAAIAAPALPCPAVVAPSCAGNGVIANGWIGNGLIGTEWIGNGLIGNGLEIVPTSGGGLAVSSSSSIAPSGLSLASENVFEGALSVAGELPFVSAVALEGALPSAGAGAVSYSCGNGVTAIESIAPSAAAAIAPAVAAAAPAAAYGAAARYGLGGYGLGAAGFAPNLVYPGIVGRECGCA
ncbi:chorion class B protein Ld34-like [Spodoptera frugiperda]|uniref:Chorion class B protein Ld34-like n=1 Tax=Spodoptera frugiperda TaxID=7108 RepID=A0A9R0DIH2_SPOFR|nr:chorion class B protein Ld34-like [Spodoptera frugiperda]